MHSPPSKKTKPLARPTQAERTALAEQKMVEATIELLNTVGLAGTTLIAIGESAGYSRGLASHHFGSKSGLFRKVLKHITSVWTKELENHLDGKTGLQAILAALDAHRAHLRSYPEHARAMFILWSGSFDPASEFKPNVIEFHRIQRGSKSLRAAFCDVSFMASTSRVCSWLFSGTLNVMVGNWTPRM